MTGLSQPGGSGLDVRSALVLVEPQFAPGEVLWHGMAFAGGNVVNDVTGSNRRAILEDCLDALAAAGIAIAHLEGAE